MHYIVELSITNPQLVDGKSTISKTVIANDEITALAKAIDLIKTENPTYSQWHIDTWAVSLTDE